MIKKVYFALEELAFDTVMNISIPILIWWVNYGLRREDLTEELMEFWKDYNHV